MTLAEVYPLPNGCHAAAVLNIVRQTGQIDPSWFHIAAGCWSAFFDSLTFTDTDDLFQALKPHWSDTPYFWQNHVPELHDPVDYQAPTAPPTAPWKLFYCCWVAVTMGAPADVVENRYWDAVSHLVDFNHCLAIDGDRDRIDPEDFPLYDRWLTIIDTWSDYDHWPLSDILDAEIYRPAMLDVLNLAGLSLAGGQVARTATACRACGQPSPTHTDRCRIAMRERADRLSRAALEGQV